MRILPLGLATASILVLIHCKAAEEAPPQDAPVDQTDVPTTPPDGTSSGGGSSGASSTSSSGSGGSSGTPTQDGGADAGPQDPCAGKAVCVDFENHKLGEAPQAPFKVGDIVRGTVAVDDERAFSGKQSVKITTRQGGQYKSALFFAEAEPNKPLVATKTIFGRMMVWADRPANDGVHWTMIAGSGPAPDAEGVTALYRYGGQINGRLMANYETLGANTDCWKHSQTSLPTKKWVCMEWSFDSAANEMHFRLDGQEIEDLKLKDTGDGCIGDDFNGVWRAPTSFDRVSFGWETYQPDDPQTMWIDDVVIADKAIGCP